jgi:hypothetical protein
MAKAAEPEPLNLYSCRPTAITQTRVVLIMTRWERPSKSAPDVNGRAKMRVRATMTREKTEESGPPCIYPHDDSR